MPGLKSQFPEQMGVAEGMAAFEFRTALEAVVHEDVLETGQELQSLEGGGAPFGVRRKPAERFRDQGMEPMETSPRPDPGLVRSRNGLPQQGFGNLHVRRFQAATRFPDQVRHRPRGRMDATPGFEQFASAFGRQHLVLGEADRQCPETGAVLHGSLNLIGEGSLLEVSASTAGLPAPMLGDLQDGRRKAGHLAGLTVARLQRSPAGFAVLRGKVIHQEIGRFRTGKCEAGMSGNAADRTLTWLAQRTRFAQTI